MDETTILTTLKEACTCFLNGDRAEYRARIDRAGTEIEALPPDASNTREPLRGEWLLASALPHLREPRRLTELYAEAEHRLRGRSRVFDGTFPFHLGASGLLGLVHTEPGGARRRVKELRGAVVVYQRLTGGGTGVDLLCEADLAYYSGDLQEGEVLAYRAAYAADAAGQDVLLMDAAKLIAHIAKHKCDRQSWDFALNALNNAQGKRRPNEALCRAKRDVIRDELLLSLGDLSPGERTQDIPALHPELLYRSTDFWTHLLYLFFSGQYERCLGASAVYLDACRAIKLPLVEAYILLFTGACHLAFRDRERARHAVNSGLDIAFADGFYLIAAEAAPLLDGLVEEYVHVRDPDAETVIKRIRTGLVDRVAQLRGSLHRTAFIETLTHRERDVARLTAEGMKNAEIAKRMHISEHTVKTHLKSIFSKLDIKQRYELRSRLKE